MIYVPTYEDYNCAYLSSSNLIRVYDSVPRPNTTISYREYAIDNHYVYRDGSTTFSTYTTLPTCLLNEEVSTNFYYRTDFADICIVAFIICFTCTFLIKGLYNSLFRNNRRWL